MGTHPIFESDFDCLTDDKMEEGAVAQVEFAYTAQESDELTLAVGDLVQNCAQKEDGWMEGTLNGKRGMFPDNFVKLIKTKVVKATPPPPPSIKPKKEKCLKQYTITKHRAKTS